MEHTLKRAGVLAFIAAVALVLATLGPVSWALAEGADDSTGEDVSPTLEINTVKELAGKRIGVPNGAIFDELVMESVDGVTENDILYFNSNAEGVGALQAGKVDAYISDSPIAELAVSKNEGLGIMPETIMDDRYAYVLPKNSPHTRELNERILAYTADGTLDKLRKSGPERMMPQRPCPKRSVMRPMERLS